MADEGERGTGRARGRARGRATPTVSSTAAFPTQETPVAPGAPGGGVARERGSGDGSGSESGTGNGSGTASRASSGSGSSSPSETDLQGIRGRGGYRERRSGNDIETAPKHENVGKGSIGTPQSLYCNYFQVTMPKDLTIHTYHVEFNPPIEVLRLRRQLIMDNFRQDFNLAFLFDGTANIKSLNKLNEEITKKSVAHPFTPDAHVEMTIKYTGPIGWASLEMMRLYNTQMRRNFQHLKYCLMGRNYFDPQGERKLTGKKISVWPGFVTAINEHEENNILMVVDFATKFVRDENVLDILTQIKNQQEEWIEEAKRQLAGQIVLTTYNNRTYRVDDIIFNVTNQTPATYMFRQGNNDINLVTYYKQRWNIDLLHHSSPLISCLPTARDRRAGKVDPIILIPELCLMTGLTDKMRNDRKFMTSISEYSRLDPQTRCQRLNALIRKINSDPAVQNDLAEWGTSYDPNLIKLTGRLLPQEKIQMKGVESSYQQPTGDFSKELRSKNLFQTPNIQYWAIFVAQRDAQLVNEFSETMQRVSGPMGMRMAKPRVTILTNDSAGKYVEGCKSLTSPCEMVVCIVPNNNKDRYDAIKKVTCIDNPIPSQVVVGKTISEKPKMMSVCTKIAIQMSCKMGGEPWAVNIPPKDVMIVGYDTYHDSSKKGSSVGAFVSSTNSTLTSWYSRVSYHTTQEEMSSNFAANLKDGILEYHKKQGRMPKRVLIYRDGVGEGMLPHVYETELTQMMDVVTKMNQLDNIFMSFTVVTKRINTRFFREIGTRKVDNPVSGTVVDTVVTRRNRWDFYLVSQSVRQGTVSPTHYNIIYDENKWKANNHQQMAYKLTHLYYNWPGTISVPAPCAYAHKLAYLVGTSLHREPSIQLAYKLFYL